MQKTVIGVLVILVLALLGFNTRLQERERLLEERLAAAERKRTPRPIPAPAPEPAMAVAEPLRPAPAPAATVKVEAPVPAPTAPRTETAKSPAWTGGTAATERFLERSIQAVELTVVDGKLTVPAQVLTLQSEEPPLPEGRKPGYLGISGGDAQGGGAQVFDVFPNGVAGAAGLKSGDVIVEFNGASVQGLADLARRIRESGEGAPISLRIRRDGTEFYQGVQLGPRPQ
jgi:membrane-associated protease RseP (regulator of RpoE activity)